MFIAYLTSRLCTRESMGSAEALSVHLHGIIQQLSKLFRMLRHWSVTVILWFGCLGISSARSDKCIN